MGYEHSNTTLETESDEIIKSGVEELVPILNENEVTSEDKRECDVPVCENFPICDDHSDIFSDSKIDDDILVYDDDFEDIEYIEESLSDPEIVNVEEENVVNKKRKSDNTTTHADDSLPKYDSFCFEIEPDQERLINAMKNDISNDSSNDPLLEEADLFLASDNLIPPVPLPPPKPPDAEFNKGEEISVVINDKDEFDDDYYSFMFVTYSKVFSFLLSDESEDTIFDPGFAHHRLKFLVFGYLSRSKRS
nr:hypothetical protein [Tanacetum cinerariifolium]